MPSDSPENLPANPGSNRARPIDGRALYIDSFHYHPNDLTEIRRISEINPELASEIVSSNREATRRMDNSFRLGLIVTAALAAATLAGTVYIVVNVGVFQTIAFIAAMLGTAFLLRVILTGEWSDTSWFGRLFGKDVSDK